jgi:hypothetical protein
MPQANDNSAQLLSAAIKSLPLGVNKERFRIFLFGPGLQVGEVVPEPTPDEPLEKHAKFLRYFVGEELRAKGWVVDFGESPEVIDAWAKVRGTSDPGNMEYLHALVACGAVIILPSSPGSFCEMGLFAASKDISQKTLALVHDGYEDSTSFFRKGLVRIFQARGGQCAYKTYRDKAVALARVVEFVEDRYNSYQWDDLDISAGKRRKSEKRPKSF